MAENECEIRIRKVIIALSLFYSCTVFADWPEGFLKLQDGVYRGARPQSTGKESQWATISELQPVADARTLTVIDLQGGDSWTSAFGAQGESAEDRENEKFEVESLGLAFLNEPLSSFSSVDDNEDQKIETVLEFMQRAAQDPIHFQVFVHCQRGRDRTGLVSALFRVRYQGWEPSKAYQEWLDLGHSDFIGEVLSQALDQYFFTKTKWSPEGPL